jgi:hypothetical protein
MVESMTILILFAVYAIAYIGVSYLSPTKRQMVGQFVVTMLASIASYAVVSFFNEQRAAWKSSGIGPMPDHIMNSDSIRLYVTIGALIIVGIGFVHLSVQSMEKCACEWAPISYVIGAIAMATILVVFPTAKRHTNPTVAQENVVLETVLYDGQSNMDVVYLYRHGESPWISVSEPTTIQDVEWAKQWRVKQGGQVVTIHHTPTLSKSPKLRIDMDGIDSDEFTSWLANTDEQIRITRVVKQHITDSLKTLPRDIIVVYYEPVNKQVYQQYKDMRALDTKVNPEQHEKEE